MKILSVSLQQGDIQVAKFEFATEANTGEIWEAIRGLELRASSIRPVAPVRQAVPSGRKYRNVMEFFGNLEEERVELSFADFARLLGAELPPSAYTYRAWWANDPQHSQARAWLVPGWRVKEVDMTGEKAVFEKTK